MSPGRAKPARKLSPEQVRARTATHEFQLGTNRLCVLGDGTLFLESEDGESDELEPSKAIEVAEAIFEGARKTLPSG